MDTPWLNNCNGAISLSFDDGSQAQLDIAIPILDEFGLHGTFYINPRDTSNLEPWRRVGLNGHEIGNHTIQHICTQNFNCLLYTSPSPRDGLLSRMPSSA